MKKLTVLLLFLSIIYCAKGQISEKSAIEAEQSTHVDTVLKYIGKETTFRGRIHKVRVLGDSVLILTCSELQYANKSLALIITDRKTVSNQNFSNYVGMGIMVKGVLTYYNGLPAFIMSGQSTGPITTVVIRPVPKDAKSFY